MGCHCELMNRNILIDISMISVNCWVWIIDISKILLLLCWILDYEISFWLVCSFWDGNKCLGFEVTWFFADRSHHLHLHLGSHHLSCHPLSAAAAGPFDNVLALRATSIWWTVLAIYKQAAIFVMFFISVAFSSPIHPLSQQQQQPWWRQVLVTRCHQKVASPLWSKMIKDSPSIAPPLTSLHFHQYTNLLRIKTSHPIIDFLTAYMSQLMGLVCKIGSSQRWHLAVTKIWPSDFLEEERADLVDTVKDEAVSLVWKC